MNKICPLLKLNYCPVCKSTVDNTSSHWSCPNLCAKAWNNISVYWVITPKYLIRFSSSGSSGSDEMTRIYLATGDERNIQLELSYWFDENFISSPNLNEKIEALLFYK
jgi:hypothetical protein